MNELQNVDTLTAEILILKNQTAQNIIEIGKKQLGNKATLKQISNYTAPMFNLDAETCFNLITNLRVVE